MIFILTYPINLDLIIEAVLRATERIVVQYNDDVKQIKILDIVAIVPEFYLAYDDY